MGMGPLGHGSGRAYADAIQSGARRHVERATVVTPRSIGRHFRGLDGAEMPPIWGDYPDTTGAGGPEVSVVVHF